MPFSAVIFGNCWNELLSKLFWSELFLEAGRFREMNSCSDRLVPCRTLLVDCQARISPWVSAMSWSYQCGSYRNIMGCGSNLTERVDFRNFPFARTLTPGLLYGRWIATTELCALRLIADYRASRKDSQQCSRFNYALRFFLLTIHPFFQERGMLILNEEDMGCKISKIGLLSSVSSSPRLISLPHSMAWDAGLCGIIGAYGCSFDEFYANFFFSIHSLVLTPAAARMARSCGLALRVWVSPYSHDVKLVSTRLVIHHRLCR